MSKKRLQPRSVGRIINDLEKDQTVIITESEQTPPMERLRQKTNLKLFYKTISTAGRGRFVSPPFPVEWVPDTTDFIEKEIEDFKEVVVERSESSLTEIGVQVKPAKKFFDYRTKWAFTTSTVNQFTPEFASEVMNQKPVYRMKHRRNYVPQCVA